MKAFKVCVFAALAFLAACSGTRPGAVVSPKRLDSLERPVPAAPALNESPASDSKVVNRLFDFEKAKPLPYTDSATDYSEYQKRMLFEERPVVEIEIPDADVRPNPPALEVEAPGDGDGFLRVAVLSPGSSPEVAREIRNAAALAMFNVRSDRVILQFYDSKGTAEGAGQAVRKAAAEGASVVVGPLFADEVRGVRSDSPGVPVISFTTDQGVLGSGVFSIGFLLEQQIRRIVEFAAANGRTRFALVLPKSSTGGFIRSVFGKYASLAGAEIIAEESYAKGAAVKAVKDVSDFDRRAKEYREYSEDVKKRLSYLLSLKESNPGEFAAAFDSTQYAASADEVASLERIEAELAKKTTVSDPDYDAIFMYGDDLNDVIMIGSTLMYYDVHPDRIKFMGTSQLENSKVYSERAFRGAWYPSVSTRYSPQFEAAYKQYFGRAPGRIASLAYDAVALVATVGASGGGIGGFDILNPNGWTGINGIFRFRPDGSSERNIDVREVVGGARTNTKIISPAASSFVRD